eukprot:6202556-Pleurochrysis_carterae.AAC.1
MPWFSFAASEAQTLVRLARSFPRSSRLPELLAILVECCGAFVAQGEQRAVGRGHRRGHHVARGADGEAAEEGVRRVATSSGRLSKANCRGGIWKNERGA